jgi:Ni,Fe-hydrogenase I large subunit
VIELGVNITKSGIPIIWLDTLAVIEIHKTIEGQSRDSRIRKLHEIIQEKVVQRRLICPLGEQEEEIDEVVNKVIRNFINLSFGISFLSYDEIKQRQIVKAMKSYGKSQVVEITFMDAFHRDPIIELNSNFPFILSVVIEPTEMDIENRKITKQQNLEELQFAKDNFYKNKEFINQIDDELDGYFKATLHVLEMYENKTKNNIPLTEVEQNRVINLLGMPLSLWKRYHKSGLSGYLEFLRSNDFKQLPHIEIASYMTADLFTSKRKSIEVGDPTDISNISTLLPYCDYILTDRDQMNRIRRLGIDKKYSTKIYSLSTINDLFSELESKFDR